MLVVEGPELMRELDGQTNKIGSPRRNRLRMSAPKRFLGAHGSKRPVAIKRIDDQVVWVERLGGDEELAAGSADLAVWTHDGDILG